MCTLGGRGHAQWQIGFHYTFDMETIDYYAYNNEANYSTMFITKG